MGYCTSKDIRIIMNQIKINKCNLKKLEQWKKMYMGTYPYGQDTKKLVDFIFSYLDRKVINGEVKNKAYKHSKEECIVEETV